MIEPGGSLSTISGFTSGALSRTLSHHLHCRDPLTDYPRFISSRCAKHLTACLTPTAKTNHMRSSISFFHLTALVTRLIAGFAKHYIRPPAPFLLSYNIFSIATPCVKTTSILCILSHHSFRTSISTIPSSRQHNSFILQLTLRATDCSPEDVGIPGSRPPSPQRRQQPRTTVSLSPSNQQHTAP